ncbi:MAG: response regulator [Candidatus Heimdallarchaeaceae archaeon]
MVKIFTCKKKEILTGKNRENKRILLVEDDEILRELTTLILRKYQFDIVEAVNGFEALQLFDETIDLVLTDIIMPKMDGIELILELQRKHPNLKCIAITGYSNVDVPQDIEVIHKPIGCKKLAAILNERLAVA